MAKGTRGGRPENKPYLPRIHSNWNHLPTISRRYPELFIEGLGEIARLVDRRKNPELFIEGLEAIARWVDSQDDPEGAIALILEFIKDKE